MEGAKFFFYSVGSDSFFVAELFVFVEEARFDVGENGIGVGTLVEKPLQVVEVVLFGFPAVEGFCWWAGDLAIFVDEVREVGYLGFNESCWFFGFL